MTGGRRSLIDVVAALPGLHAATRPVLHYPAPVVALEKALPVGNGRLAVEGSRDGDFVCLNTYGASPQQNYTNLDRAHELFPDRPLAVSEYGLRRNGVENEIEFVAWFREMPALFETRRFVAGAAAWSFDDYRSLYVGAGANGGVHGASSNPTEHRGRATMHCAANTPASSFTKPPSVPTSPPCKSKPAQSFPCLQSRNASCKSAFRTDKIIRYRPRRCRCAPIRR
jgi:beta-glucuronidase